MSTDPPFDVFLSHCSDDKLAVETLAHRLRDDGLKPWLDTWNLIPGEPWQPAIEDALRQCPACVVCLGLGKMGPWQHAEMRAAINRQVAQPGSVRVIPVLLPGASRDGLDLPDFLTATTWVEFSDSLDDADAFHRLRCGIRGVEPGPGPTAAAANSIAAAGTSGLPDLWTVPHHRNRDFTGREEILESLRSELSSGSAAAVTQAIAGLGAWARRNSPSSTRIVMPVNMTRCCGSGPTEPSRRRRIWPGRRWN